MGKFRVATIFCIAIILIGLIVPIFSYQIPWSEKIILALSMGIGGGLMTSPLIILYFSTRKFFTNWQDNSVFSKILLIILMVLSMVPPMLFSTMWGFDVDGIASGKSTAGLAIVALPVYILLLSALPYLALFIAQAIKKRH